MTKKVFIFFVMLLLYGVITAQSQNDNRQFLNAQFLILDEVQPLTLEERETMESIFYEEPAPYTRGGEGVEFELFQKKYKS